jgi:succinyl-diaminopimelate desuccinylase
LKRIKKYEEIKMKERIINLTKELVRIKSETKNYNTVNEAHEFLRKYIQENLEEFNLEIFEQNDVKTYYYKHKNVKGKEICLCGHIDVVPGNNEQYIPKEDGNFLYGRGVGDMKSGVATIIELFLKYSNKNISLLITGDEEVGGPNGAGFVSDKINPEVVILTEPTDNKMILTEKGGSWVEISVKAPGGHASRPWQAKNAVDILFDIISKIRLDYPILGKEDWKKTMNIGAIMGGENIYADEKISHGAANKIAQYASCRLDFRITENTSINELLNYINKITDEKREELKEKYSIDVKKITHVDLMHTKSDNSYVVKFMESMQKNNLDATPEKEHGASDGRFFSKKGIPVIVFGPKSTGYHSDNEKVEIDSIVKVYEVIDDFIKNI